MEHVWQLKRKWDIGTLRSDLLMVSRYEKSVNTDCPKPQELTGIRANHLPLCEHSDSFYCLCWCRIFLFSWPIQGTFWHWDLLLTGCHGVWIKKHCSWDFTGTLSRIGVIRTRTCLVAQWLRFCLPMQGVQVWFLVRELRCHRVWPKKLKKKKKEPECLPWEELWLLGCQLGLSFDTATFGSVPSGKLLNVPEHQFSLQ